MPRPHLADQTCAAALDDRLEALLDLHLHIGTKAPRFAMNFRTGLWVRAHQTVFRRVGAVRRRRDGRGARPVAGRLRLVAPHVGGLAPALARAAEVELRGSINPEYAALAAFLKKHDTKRDK